MKTLHFTTLISLKLDMNLC